MRIRPFFLRSAILSRLHRRTVPINGQGPIVSFTFDDFPRTAATAGAAILESFGARGTFYTAPSLMNSTSDLGEQFRLDDLQRLAAAGHEIASHTFSHTSCEAVSQKDFLDEVDRGRLALTKLVGTASANFSYPFGDVTPAIKKSLGPTLASSRSIFPGLNGPEIDLNLLKANSLYGGQDGSVTESIAAAKKLIAENAARKSWLIFYTHDVQPQPSAWGCTPELLRATVATAVDSRNQVLTVEAALTAMGVQNGKTAGHVRLKELV